VSSDEEREHDYERNRKIVKEAANSNLPRLCPRCGRPQPPESRECPYCGAVAGRQYRRSTIVILWLVCCVALFVVASTVTHAYDNKLQVLADRWYQRGLQALDTGQPDAAISDFRNALTYSHQNPQYRLQLAEALLAAGRTQEALDYFQSLWQENPSQGRVNLALARLAARRRDIPQAIRYYHGAIYGEWDRDPIQHRNRAQLELVKVLLQNGATAEAQSELLALSQEAPNDPALHMEIARLFAQAGDFEDALQENRKVLSLEPRDAAAMSGAGIAAFELGNYRTAEEYLHKAVERDPSNKTAAEYLETLRLMTTWNPYERGLSSSERRRRVIQAFNQAGTRLESCAAMRGENLDVEQSTTELQKLYDQWSDLSPGMNERILRMQPDLADSAMDLGFRIEERAKALCGAPTGPDEALLLIGEDRQGGGH